ncbi:F-box only protein 5 [Cyprinodon tularosa]|uniref:F-box only protein 5 n=1 Tax=Cyprinodon tularosa TaxID=77115 RepID=UPI0018E27013|nr:F-box only protein 5 [Cyprinodon tularosa]
MFNLTMKCPMIRSTKESTMEKSLAAAEAKVLYPKDSPKKEPSPIKPQHSPAGVTTELFPIKSDTSTVHNKENSTNREQDGISDEFFEDSGYLSLINSHIDHHVDEEGEVIAGIHRGKTVSANNSPTKCQGSARLSLPGTLSVHTPVDRHKRATGAMSSTPANQHRSNLPILRFQQDVCEELAKSYKKNKRYDWSVIPKIAEDHLLDRIIGGQIGLEHIDMFTSLLVRNMKIILTNILAMLGDMDLISCRQVSRTWRKIICEDSAAMRRCRQAEQALRESRSSRMKTASGMTRDLATSRVVLSCMQTLASSSTPASSQSPSRHSCRTTRHTPTSRFSEYSQAASSLKQHESLRSCRRCGSPATHSAEVQRARCTRSNCLFEFCTRCQEPFHGSAPCRTVKPHMNSKTSKVTPIIAGGPRSKQSVRRL